MSRAAMTVAATDGGRLAEKTDCRAL